MNLFGRYLEEGRGFTGAQTVLLNRKKLELAFGGATGYSKGRNFPFVCLQTKLSPVFFATDDNDMKFGVFYGYESNGKLNHWGLSASLALW